MTSVVRARPARREDRRDFGRRGAHGMQRGGDPLHGDVGREADAAGNRAGVGGNIGAKRQCDRPVTDGGGADHHVATRDHGTVLAIDDQARGALGTHAQLTNARVGGRLDDAVCERDLHGSLVFDHGGLLAERLVDGSGDPCGRAQVRFAQQQARRCGNGGARQVGLENATVGMRADLDRGGVSRGRASSLSRIAPAPSRGGPRISDERRHVEHTALERPRITHRRDLHLEPAARAQERRDFGGHEHCGHVAHANELGRDFDIETTQDVDHALHGLSGGLPADGAITGPVEADHQPVADQANRQRAFRRRDVADLDVALACTDAGSNDSRAASTVSREDGARQRRMGSRSRQNAPRTLLMIPCLGLSSGPGEVPELCVRDAIRLDHVGGRNVLRPDEAGEDDVLTALVDVDVLRALQLQQSVRGDRDHAHAEFVLEPVLAARRTALLLVGTVAGVEPDVLAGVRQPQGREAAVRVRREVLLGAVEIV
jgi:hypothetical protein